jgi:hypothetical protein
MQFFSKVGKIIYLTLKIIYEQTMDYIYIV